MNFFLILQSYLQNLYRKAMLELFQPSVAVKQEIIPNPSDRAIWTMEQVDSYFGFLPTTLLMFDRPLLGSQSFPPPWEFHWFVSTQEDDVLSARWNNKFFRWNGNGWEREYTEAEKQQLVVQQRKEKEQEKVDRVLGILRTISNLSVESGELEVWFDDAYYNLPESIHSFIPDSFTRCLLELIESHLLGSLNENTLSPSDPRLGQEQETHSRSTQSD
jgi:hypothetical protein